MLKLMLKTRSQYCAGFVHIILIIRHRLTIYRVVLPHFNFLIIGNVSFLDYYRIDLRVENNFFYEIDEKPIDIILATIIFSLNFILFLVEDFLTVLRKPLEFITYLQPCKTPIKPS